MRYLILLLLNVPIIFVALLNFVTKYKMHRITKERFRFQVILWALLLIVLIGSFPVYNYLIGRPVLASNDLSFFDIVQTAAIVVLFYVINTQRQKIDQTERMVRDLHQELSIKVSALEDDKAANR